jgi:hypothetical protein
MYCPINEATQTPQDDFEINKQSRLSLECILNSEKQTLYDTRKQINMLKSSYCRQNYIHCILLFVRFAIVGV